MRARTARWLHRLARRIQPPRDHTDEIRKAVQQVNQLKQHLDRTT